MKQLTNEKLTKNCVETINQFKVLEYLKKNLNVFSFKIFLYDKNTLKVIDEKENQAYFKYDEDTLKVIDEKENQAYFKYDEDTNEVLFLEENFEKNDDYEL